MALDHPKTRTAALAIANLVVSTTAAVTGRGPGTAYTHMSGDLISVVLSDVLTKAEHSLVAAGREDLVLETRKVFQNIMRTDLIAGVEGITGRRVLAFMSENHVDPDVAIESFVLAPLTDRD